MDQLLGAVTDGRTIICLATHARGAVGELFIGSVSEELLRRSRVPIVLVGPKVPNDPPAHYSTLLTCIDGSRRWQPLVEEMPRWTTPGAMETWLLQVLPAGATDAGDAPDVLHQLTELLDRNGDEVQWDVTYDDDPVAAIGRFADKLDSPLIAVASCRRNRRERLTRPSVTLALARKASHPILAVPTSLD